MGADCTTCRQLTIMESLHSSSVCLSIFQTAQLVCAFSRQFGGNLLILSWLTFLPWWCEPIPGISVHQRVVLTAYIAWEWKKPRESWRLWVCFMSLKNYVLDGILRLPLERSVPPRASLLYHYHPFNILCTQLHSYLQDRMFDSQRKLLHKAPALLRGKDSSNSDPWNSP